MLPLAAFPLHWCPGAPCNSILPFNSKRSIATSSGPRRHGDSGGATGSKVRFARYPPATRKAGGFLQPWQSMSDSAILQQLTRQCFGRRAHTISVINRNTLSSVEGSAFREYHPVDWHFSDIVRNLQLFLYLVWSLEISQWRRQARQLEFRGAKRARSSVHVLVRTHDRTTARWGGEAFAADQT